MVCWTDCPAFVRAKHLFSVFASIILRLSDLNILFGFGNVHLVLELIKDL